MVHARVESTELVRALYAQPENVLQIGIFLPRQRTINPTAGGGKPVSAGSPYLITEAVCERLHCSRRSVHEMARLSQIPHRKLPGSRRLLFRVDELEAWEGGAPLEEITLERGGRIVRPVTR